MNGLHPKKAQLYQTNGEQKTRVKTQLVRPRTRTAGFSKPMIDIYLNRRRAARTCSRE
ncbi:hypothetical protein PHLCEN_2v825 [Hermanssonia centrifuga]|uniref:Uncharacterized protein n=1 Tax=Hermanssonia centrifuga TaxID=98765 RepID=A0A2R6S4Z4_9APHY|nr:hypothetical protein PHLCEN_2v825 [Hermanssonia centrifuga]